MSRDAWLTLWHATDGNYNYGAARQAFLGEEGSRCKEVVFRRFGSSRRHGVKISCTSPTRVDFLAMAIEAEPER